MVKNKRLLQIMIIMLTAAILIACTPASVSYAASSPGMTKITVAKRLSNTSASIKISWKKIPGAYGYSLYRSTKSDRAYKRIRSTIKTSYTDTKRPTGKTYYYKVKAYKYVNGKRVYGLFSAVKSVKMTYINPVLSIEIDKRLPDYPKDTSPYSVGFLIHTSSYCEQLKILTEVKRPYYSKKIMARVQKNAVKGPATKTVYYKFNPMRTSNYSCGYPNILSTGNSASDYKYALYSNPKGSISFASRIYFGLDPINYKTSAGRYDPAKDVLQFYIIYKDQLYSIKYDEKNGVRTAKVS